MVDTVPNLKLRVGYNLDNIIILNVFIKRTDEAINPKDIETR